MLRPLNSVKLARIRTVTITLSLVLGLCSTAHMLTYVRLHIPIWQESRRETAWGEKGLVGGKGNEGRGGGREQIWSKSMVCLNETILRKPRLCMNWCWQKAVVWFKETGRHWSNSNYLLYMLCGLHWISSAPPASFSPHVSGTREEAVWGGEHRCHILFFLPLFEIKKTVPGAGERKWAAGGSTLVGLWPSWGGNHVWLQYWVKNWLVFSACMCTLYWPGILLICLECKCSM